MAEMRSFVLSGGPVGASRWLTTYSAQVACLSAQDEGMRPWPCLPASAFVLDTLDVYIKRHNGSSASFTNPLWVNVLNVMRTMVFEPPCFCDK